MRVCLAQANVTTIGPVSAAQTGESQGQADESSSFTNPKLSTRITSYQGFLPLSISTATR